MLKEKEFKQSHINAIQKYKSGKGSTAKNQLEKVLLHYHHIHINWLLVHSLITLIELEINENY